MRLRTVFRRDTLQGHFRLFRVIYGNRTTVGQRGCKPSKAFSVALCPFRLKWSPQPNGWILFLGFLRLHDQRSYGGVFG